MLSDGGDSDGGDNEKMLADRVAYQLLTNRRVLRRPAERVAQITVSMRRLRRQKKTIAYL